MFQDNLEVIVSDIAKNYEAEEIFITKGDKHFPNRNAIIDILDDIRHLFFPGYFGNISLEGVKSEYYIGQLVLRINSMLRQQLYLAFQFRDGSTMSAQEISNRVEEVCQSFFEQLPVIQRVLLTDVQAAFDGDPAAESKEEIVLTYPGFFAISIYRVAHALYSQNVPLIPRIMSEYAHGLTGVDINPGADIDEYFFIDHATGVVIGETTKIGKHVKVYQGVTLGALSTRAGQALSGVKRHPTIEDNVTIYSNACVLGGETVVGEGSIIAGSAFVIKSVPANSRVGVKNQEVTVRVPEPKPSAWEI